jgi:hypothetical protein
MKPNRIREIEDWLMMESSKRFKPYPKRRHPVAWEQRMRALGVRSELEAQAKKISMERELKLLERKNEVRPPADNPGPSGSGNNPVLSVSPDRMPPAREKSKGPR